MGPFGFFPSRRGGLCKSVDESNKAKRSATWILAIWGTQLGTNGKSSEVHISRDKTG